jgi:hypothetical protein
MDSVQQIIETLFGGEISIDKVTTILVALFAVIKSFTEWRAKAKLIKADKELSSADEKIAAMQTNLDSLKESNSYLADIIITAFLSSNTMDDSIKKKIVDYALTMEKIADVDLEAMTVKVINTIAEHIPGATLNERKEEIITEVKAAEQILESAAEDANSMIDKLGV